MADEENNNECKCTGWKVGFYIFVVLSIIMFILVLILWFYSGRKKDALKGETYGLLSRGAQKIADKLNAKKEIIDSSTSRNSVKQTENQAGGYDELERILSSTTQ